MPSSATCHEGPPGHWQEHLARALGSALRWPVLDKDDVKDVLDGRAPDAGGLAYETLGRLARTHIKLRLSVNASDVNPITCY